MAVAGTLVGLLVAVGGRAVAAVFVGVFVITSIADFVGKAVGCRVVAVAVGGCVAWAVTIGGRAVGLVDRLMVTAWLLGSTITEPLVKSLFQAVPL